MEALESFFIDNNYFHEKKEGLKLTGYQILALQTMVQDSFIMHTESMQFPYALAEVLVYRSLTQIIKKVNRHVKNLHYNKSKMKKITLPAYDWLMIWNLIAYHYKDSDFVSLQREIHKVVNLHEPW